MKRLGSVLGSAFGLAMIVAAYAVMQNASVAETQTAALNAPGCVKENVALDEGYGVTRTETRIVCRDAAAEKDKPYDEEK